MVGGGCFRSGVTRIEVHGEAGRVAVRRGLGCGPTPGRGSGSSRQVGEAIEVGATGAVHWSGVGAGKSRGAQVGPEAAALAEDACPVQGSVGAIATNEQGVGIDAYADAFSIGVLDLVLERYGVGAGALGIVCADSPLTVGSPDFQNRLGRASDGDGLVEGDPDRDEFVAGVCGVAFWREDLGLNHPGSAELAGDLAIRVRAGRGVGEHGVDAGFWVTEVVGGIVIQGFGVVADAHSVIVVPVCGDGGAEPDGVVVLACVYQGLHGPADLDFESRGVVDLDRFVKGDADDEEVSDAVGIVAWWPRKPGLPAGVGHLPGVHDLDAVGDDVGRAG